MTCIDAHIELAPRVCAEVCVHPGAGLRASLQPCASAVSLGMVTALRGASLRMVGGDMRVRLVPVCKGNIAGPYLEIAPSILWLADWAVNDVYSNTDWIVQ